MLASAAFPGNVTSVVIVAGQLYVAVQGGIVVQLDTKTLAKLRDVPSKLTELLTFSASIDEAEGMQCVLVSCPALMGCIAVRRQKVISGVLLDENLP